MRADGVKRDPATGKLCGREKGVAPGQVFRKGMHVLNGLLRCGVCGRPFAILLTRTDARGRLVRSVGCLRHQRHSEFCTNVGIVTLAAVEDALSVALIRHFSDFKLMVQLRQMFLIAFRRCGSGFVFVEVQNVVAKIRRHSRKIFFREFIHEFRVGFVGNSIHARGGALVEACHPAGQGIDAGQQVGLEVALAGAVSAGLRAAHEVSDWVITADPLFSIELLDRSHARDDDAVLKAKALAQAEASLEASPSTSAITFFGFPCLSSSTSDQIAPAIGFDSPCWMF